MNVPRGLTAGDVAKIWELSVSQVYRLANDRGWRRYRQGRQVFYHPEDVTRAMEERVAGDGSNEPS